ncbi:hypothetical protein [Nonomuraea rosea]|uniref:efflux RND transporter periplasmic adaptor subunit n=1 Tax=Nonomuraea rosea TaxID=638574 RepID=UPI0031F01D36
MLAGLVVITASVTLAWAWNRPADADGEDQAFDTAAVAVRDLHRTQTLSGVVAYRDLRGLSSPLKGTITWLPGVGDDLSSGDVLFKVDNRPVVVLHGEVAAWRDLRPGMSDGVDVKQLEAALLALGHGKKSRAFPDAHWDGRTTRALKKLQAEVAARRDGIAFRGELVFTSGDIHIAQLVSHVGDQMPSDEAPLTVQSTDRVVLLDLNPMDRNLVKKGAPVQIELPGGERTPGKIESIGTTLETDADGNGVFKVNVALTDPSAVQTLQLAPVSVHYITTLAEKVLSVPVTAIVGMPGGGYAVDIAGPGGTSRRAPVTLGAWGDGFVQVGGDVKAGDRVEVPR